MEEEEEGADLSSRGSASKGGTACSCCCDGLPENMDRTPNRDFDELMQEEGGARLIAPCENPNSGELDKEYSSVRSSIHRRRKRKKKIAEGEGNQ